MSSSGATFTAYRLVAIGLIVAGGIGLAYGKLSVTEDSHTVQVGSMGMTVRDQHSMNVPVWAGVGAIVAGSLALVAMGRGPRS